MDGDEEHVEHTTTEPLMNDEEIAIVCVFSTISIMIWIVCGYVICKYRKINGPQWGDEHFLDKGFKYKEDEEDDEVGPDGKSKGSPDNQAEDDKKSQMSDGKKSQMSDWKKSQTADGKKSLTASLKGSKMDGSKKAVDSKGAQDKKSLVKVPLGGKKDTSPKKAIVKAATVKKAK